jgi:pimeloyl-ACP methyl ester carboxylesterase
MRAFERTLGLLAQWGHESSWEGFACYEGSVDGRACKVVVPAGEVPGRKWAWRAEFFGIFANVDLALVRLGYYLVYMDVVDHYGCPKAVGHWDAMYRFVTRELRLAKKPVLIGLSRGGLMVYNWAARNPRRVACIYADAPVCDILSWPGGKGVGTGNPTDWPKCLAVYGLTESSVLAFRGNPIDHLQPLAARHIPLIHVCGTADTGVPMAENTDVLAACYRELGGEITVIAKEGCGHHPHSLEDPQPIVDFILRHS